MPDNEGNDQPDLNQLATDFLKEEHKQRRAEIENLIGRIEGDQRYALVITGLVWSWLATNQKDLHAPFDLVVIFLPAVVMIFFLWRWDGIETLIALNAYYMRMLEERARLPKDLGWERFMDDNRKRTGKRDKLTRSTRSYWCALLMVNVVLAVLFLCFQKGTRIR